MSTTTTELPIGELHESPMNPRRRVSEDVKDLTASVRAQGILQPLLVRRNEQGYEIIAGHRRFRAAKKAGLETVPAIVREMGDSEVRQVMLVENLQRVDLNPVEEARTILELTVAGMTEKDLAEAIGRSKSFVESRLRLMELRPRLQKAVEAGLPLARVDRLLEFQQKAPEVFDPEQELGEHLDEALERMADGNSWKIDDLQNRVVRERVLRQIIARCEEKGVQYVLQESSWEMPKGVLLLPGKDVGPYETNVLEGVDPRAHAKEPCHGVLIQLAGSGGPKARKACLDRSRHTKAGKSALKRGGADAHLSDEERERKDREREARAEQRRRNALLAEARIQAVRAAKAADRELVDVLLRRMLERATQTDLKAVCKMLGVEFEDSYDGPAAAVAGFVDQGRRQLVQAAFATALTADVYGEDFGSAALLNRAVAPFLEAVEQAGEEDTGA